MGLNNRDELILFCPHPSGRKGGTYLYRMVAIIINNGDAICLALEIKAPTHPFELAQTGKNNFRINRHLQTDGNRCQTILHIMLAQHRKLHIIEPVNLDIQPVR